MALAFVPEPYPDKVKVWLPIPVAMLLPVMVAALPFTVAVAPLFVWAEPLYAILLLAPVTTKVAGLTT